MASRLELELLAASLTGAPPFEDLVDQNGEQSLSAALGHLIIKGEYASALHLAAEKSVLTLDQSTESAGANSGESGDTSMCRESAAYFGTVQAACEKRLSAALNAGCNKSDPSRDKLLELLLVAAAALLAFVQVNLTGPPITDLPDCLAQLASYKDGSMAGKDECASATVGHTAASEADRWGISQLAASGEEAVGRIHLPQYLLLTLTVLLPPLGIAATEAGKAGRAETLSRQQGTATAHMSASPAATDKELAPTSVGNEDGVIDTGLPPTWTWWAMRALATQQRILASRAASLRLPLQALSKQVVARWADTRPQQMGGTYEEGRSLLAQLAAAVHLEAAAVEHAYGAVSNAENHLEAAEHHLGLSVSLTGAMGMRTIHQKDAKAQLTVLLQSSNSHDTPAATCDTARCDSGVDSAALDAMMEGGAGEADLKGLGQDIDILPAPLLTGNGCDGSNEGSNNNAALPSLSSLQQALLLGHAARIKKGRPSDELSGWEAAPFAEAVLSQRHSQSLIRAAARLLMARHERGRSRTRERALLTLQQLSDSLAMPSPVPAQRVRLAFAVAQPLGVTLQRELGEGLIAMGLVGSALPMFEELELWDSLIVCYQMLHKVPQAEAVVTARLEVTPDEPRLWCALGDLRLDDACYERAWLRSSGRSARAKRSLARSAMRRKEWAPAVTHWEAALALNPLNPDGWFAMGYACLKAEDDTRAVQAFTRAVQQEPDNGDAWANIAAVHLQSHSWAPAFSAASEAVKYKRDSWAAWSNYALAAMRAGHSMKALRGAQQVLQLTGGGQLEVEVLESLISQLSEALPSPPSVLADNPAIHPEPAGTGKAIQGTDRLLQGRHSDLQLGDASEISVEGVDDVGNDSNICRSNSSGGSSSGGGKESSDQEGHDPITTADELLLTPSLNQREISQLRTGLAQVLKAAAQKPSGDGAVWGLLSKFYRATGEEGSVKEALLKWTRSLQSTPWKNESVAFEALATATCQLANCFVDQADSGPAAIREVSSGRLQMRGIIKQTEQKFGETTAFGTLTETLERMEAVLKRLKDSN